MNNMQSWYSIFPKNPLLSIYAWVNFVFFRSFSFLGHHRRLKFPSVYRCCSYSFCHSAFHSNQKLGLFICGLVLKWSLML